MALSERKVANLWSRLDQLKARIAAAERNLAAAEAAGKTRRERAPLAAEVRRLKGEQLSINRQLSRD